MQQDVFIMLFPCPFILKAQISFLKGELSKKDVLKPELEVLKKQLLQLEQKQQQPSQGETHL